VERLLSFYDQGSDVARLNQSAGTGPVSISPETLNLLDLAMDWSERTGGLFDVTVGPLSALWKEAALGGAVPRPAEVESARSLLGGPKLRLDAARQTAELMSPGAAVDLGGIGKGYAARRARQVYESRGVRSALASLGGHILAVGGRPDGGPWSVGIRHPRLEGACVGAVAIRDASVSTSGDDQQSVVHDGVRYHHIVDPQTGFPARSGLASVTVVAADPVEADVLSTAVFVAGAAAALGLLALAGKAGALLVDDGGQVSVIGGGGWAFTLFSP
jgi:thiamine biosynthesis lipoprotein